MTSNTEDHVHVLSVSNAQIFTLAIYVLWLKNFKSNEPQFMFSGWKSSKYDTQSLDVLSA
jgi:hypothetical protein